MRRQGYADQQFDLLGFAASVDESSKGCLFVVYPAVNNKAFKRFARRSVAGG